MARSRSVTKMFTYERLRDGLKNGITELVASIDAEEPARLAQETPVSLEAKFLTPMYSFAVNGSLIQDTGDQVWVRSGTAVWSLPRGSVKVSPR